MEGVVEGDFISQFHNLEGDTISERKKNFYTLLKNSSIPVNDEDFQNLCPKTYLESLFKIDVLIYHKKTAELLKVLKEGNEVFISKIIKQQWFFEEVLKSMEPNEIVNNFFPCLSYPLRLKMMKKISITFEEHQMDEIFDHILKRYGIFIAKKILHRCTSKKIDDIFEIYELEFNSSQLKTIFDRDSSVFVRYLEYYKQLNGRSYDNKNVNQYIAIKNPKLWLNLQEEKKIKSCSVGRRKSKKIMELVKDEVIENTQKYSDILNNEVIVRRLHEKFKNVYFKLFPKQLLKIDFYNFCNRLLKYYPKKKQWDLFASTFQRVFDDSILNNLNYLDKQFIPLFPEKSVMYKWAEIKYKSTDSTDFLSYYNPSEGLPLIKDKINVTADMYKRKLLIYLLLNNCQYEDLEFLTEVLKYICFRHRNEGIEFHNNVLSKISNQFKLEQFNETHWKYINEEVTMLRAKKEFSFNSNRLLLEKHLEYLLASGKAFKNELQQHIIDVKEHYSYNRTFFSNLENPVVQKDLLVQVANIYPNVVKPDNKHFKELQKTLILDIINFGIKNPEHSINFHHFPSLIIHIQSIFNKTNLEGDDFKLTEKSIVYSIHFPEKINIDSDKILQLFLNIKKDNHSFVEVWKRFILKKERSEFENELVNVYFIEIYQHWASSEIVSWFIRNQPRILVPYFDKILEHHLDYNMPNYADFKLMSHLNFDKKLIEFYRNKLSPNDVHAAEMLKNLSILLSTDEFIKTVVEPYLPAQKKVNTGNEDMVKIYKLQCSIAKSLQLVTEPVKMLPVVMKFSSGDYLQSTLKSLYSIFYRSPEELLYYYIDLLSQKAVSARKHALYLSCQLVNINYVRNTIESSKFDNISSQKYMFSAILKYFVKNQSEDLYDLVILKLNTIHKNDEENLMRLTYLNVPKRYLPQYIEKCWEFYESLIEKDVKIRNYLNALKKSIFNNKDVFESLSREFCVHVIVEYFQKKKIDLCIDLTSFVTKFLTDRKNERNDNFKLIFEILSVFKVNDARKNGKLFQDLYYYASENKNDSDFLQHFTDNWLALHTPLEMFGEYLLLKFLHMKIESRDEHFIEDYAQRVLTFLDKLVLQYGELIYGTFKKKLTETLVKFSSKEKYLFFFNILKIKSSPLSCILVLDSISSPQYGDEQDVTDIYEEILEILKNVDEPVVKICYLESRNCGRLTSAGKGDDTWGKGDDTWV